MALHMVGRYYLSENLKKQDKYTIDPRQSSLSQQKVNKNVVKMIFEQKQIKNAQIMHN